jgi:heptosyltransferase-2
MNTESKTYSHILVRSTNWIGDAIMTTPALVALRNRYPQARIGVLARPWVAPVFSAHPAVDEVIPLVVRRAAQSLLDRIALAKSLRESRFDLALLFPNSFDSALMARLAGIPERVGYDTDGRGIFLTSAVPVPKERFVRHEIFHYLGLIRALENGFRQSGEAAEDDAAPHLSLHVPPQGEKGAQAVLARLRLPEEVSLVGFNPGAAYGPAKCWPVERFAALGAALTERFPRVHILVFGTGGERPVGETICHALGGRCHNLAGLTSLPEVMGLIRRLDLLVTNDSGLMHVGAALDIPLVAIFGSTNPVTTGPWSARSTVVRTELSCSPCLKRTCPEDFGCMRSIRVDQVFEACLARLQW